MDNALHYFEWLEILEICYIAVAFVRFTVKCLCVELCLQVAKLALFPRPSVVALENLENHFML